MVTNARPVCTTLADRDASFAQGDAALGVLILAEVRGER